MSDGYTTPGLPTSPSEEALRRPMAGFSPSSPDYRPLPPLNLPQRVPASRPLGTTDEMPAAPPARPGAPPPPLNPGPPTLPDGVPTPGRIPAYSGAYPTARNVPRNATRNATRNAPVVYYQPAPPSAPLAPQGRPRPDNAPVAIEAIGDIFGLYGIGWLMAGRTATGVLLVLAGLVWDTIAVGLIASGIGVCCFIPLHAVFLILSTTLLSNFIKRRG